MNLSVQKIGEKISISEKTASKDSLYFRTILEVLYQKKNRSSATKE